MPPAASANKTTPSLTPSFAPALICGVLSLLVNYVPYVEASELQHAGGGHPFVSSERR